MYYLIFYFLGLLTIVGTKKNNSANANAEANKNEKHCFPDRPISVVSLPPPQSDKERADQEKKKRRESVKFWVELFGLIVLIVYAGFTIAIWIAMQSQRDIMQQQ